MERIAGITIAGEQWNDGVPWRSPTERKEICADRWHSGQRLELERERDHHGSRHRAQRHPCKPVSNGRRGQLLGCVVRVRPGRRLHANGNLPGPETQQAQDVQVPTTAGISTVSTTIGAFGQAAQNNTGNTPLTPGTKYYYWIVQQPGATDAASNINVSAWTGATRARPRSPANNSYKCYPNVAIAAGSDAGELHRARAPSSPTAAQTLAADQGPCIYYYGNTGGALYYQSPNGTFTTPELAR